MIEPEIANLPSIHTRIDGWTVQRQADFIACLAESGSVRTAARVVCMHITSAYRCRARYPAFAQAWDAARRVAYIRLQHEAIDRALNGTPKEIGKDGKLIETGRVYNDKLLVKMLTILRDTRPAQDHRPGQRPLYGLGDASALGAAMLALGEPVTIAPKSIKQPRKKARQPIDLA
jgi:hypothetical protein